MLLVWQKALYNELLSLATLRGPPSLYTCDGQQLWVSPSIIHAVLLVIDHILDEIADVAQVIACLCWLSFCAPFKRGYRLQLKTAQLLPVWLKGKPCTRNATIRKAVKHKVQHSKRYAVFGLHLRFSGSGPTQKHPHLINERTWTFSSGPWQMRQVFKAPPYQQQQFLQH